VLINTKITLKMMIFLMGKNFGYKSVGETKQLLLVVDLKCKSPLGTTKMKRTLLILILGEFF
jgi:hypothetical protein